MSHRFETVSDVFPEKNVTPFMVLDAASVEPQWFSTIDDLLQHVRKVNVPMWVDITSGSAHERHQVLSELPFGLPINSNVIEFVMNPTENDIVELQATTSKFVHGALTCMTSHKAMRRDSSAYLANGEVDSDQPRAAEGETLCSFLVSEQVAVTLHNQPFLGLTESMWRLMHRKLPPTANEPRPFFTSTVLATLIAFTSELTLPDPTPVLNDVDAIDEMVLLIAPGDQDQPDLLRRIADLRRRISALRMRVYRKEKLLQDMMTPYMRGSFVSGQDPAILVMYKEAAEKVALVLGRLDEIRETTNQSNLNFITASSMRMTQISSNMDFKMQIFGQVATICLPLHFVASLFGMNVQVPYQKDFYPSTTAFWIIILLSFVWVIICSLPTVRYVINTWRPKALVPEA